MIVRASSFLPELDPARNLIPSKNWCQHQAGAEPMSRVIKMSTPKTKPDSLPKTAALTKAQAEHKAWLKSRSCGISMTQFGARTS
jgi:hypothetical protein